MKLRAVGFALARGVLAFALALLAARVVLPRNQSPASFDGLRGMVSVIWPDAPGDEGPDLYLKSGSSTYRIQLPDYLLQSFGGAWALHGHYVELSGDYALKSHAIQVHAIATLPEDMLPLDVIAGQHAPYGSELGAVAGFPRVKLGQAQQGAQIPPMNPHDGPLTGTKKFITILAKFSDVPGAPHPQTWYQQMMTGSPPSLNHYYNEQSYSNINLNNSLVLDWVSLPKTQSQYQTSDGFGVDFLSVENDAIAAVAGSVDFTQYYGINVIVNSSVGNIGGVGGQMSFTLNGVTRMWGITYNNSGDSMFPLLAHEMGHTFGFDHSSGPYSTPYDSLYDQMSLGSTGNVTDPTLGPLPVHTNSYHRMKVGWIPASKICNVFPGNDVTVQIQQTVRPGTSGYLMGRIFLGGDANHYLTIEARKYSGIYEKSGNLPGEGVVLHDVQELRTQASDVNPANDRRSEVVDQTLNGDPNDAGSRLEVGDTYTDLPHGVTISVQSSDSTSFMVRIAQASNQALPNTVTNTNDVGAKSLRSALTFANIFDNTTIRFAIPPSDPNFANGYAKITPLSPLPTITSKGAIIDGSTQTSNEGDTNAKGPEISIDGSQAGQFVDGIFIEGAKAVVKVIQVGNFSQYGIRVDQGSLYTSVIKSYIGEDPTGSSAAPNGYGGVLVEGNAFSTTIGGSGLGNYIGGNSGPGIVATGSQVETLTIQGNIIGLCQDGKTPNPNGAGGIQVFAGPTPVRIGGSVASVRNVISGNTGDGIYFGNLTKASIYGNFIGADVNGTLSRPNTNGGIAIDTGCSHVSIGSAVAGNGNLVSGNTTNGIWLGGATSCSIQGNLIGTDVNGALALPNTYDGIAVDAGSTGITIGGLNNAYNVISGNSRNGIGFYGAGTTVCSVMGNRVGVNGAGGAAVPNGYSGIAASPGVTKITIGGTVAGTGNTVSGNAGNGIVLFGASGFVIDGNRCGTDIAGNTAIPNGSDGLALAQGASSNAIGGSSAGSGNQFSGNGHHGVGLYDSGTNGNVFHGNIAGLNANGSAAISNGQSGIGIGAGPSSNTIGGTTAAARNVCSGNALYGVVIYGPGANSNVVSGNYIGTSSDGSTAIGNQAAGVGVFDGNQHVTIGGSKAGSGNMIAGNAADGIDVAGASNKNNTIQNNTLGLNASGASLPNGWGGIALYQGANHNLVQGNLVCGFSAVGINLANGGTTANQVYANHIGDTLSGTQANTGWTGIGLWDGAQGNQIGGVLAGQGNYISQSATGIYLSDAGTVGNSFHGNLIPSQTTAVIDLEANANHLQAAPTILNITGSGAQRSVGMSLNSSPNRTYTIDLYGCSNRLGTIGLPDVYLSTAVLVTDSNGAAVGTINVSANPIPAYISATVTDQATGDTSTMSVAVHT
ncbi:MAG TPA: hypothetical protein VG944_23375 [Fimbriimonas sp.]|nr:hypothetical protein [Fimbriimonas sp.]